MSSLKERKEQFVTGLTGGEISEINYVTSIALIGYLSWSLINSKTNLFNGDSKWELTSLLLDFILNWVCLLLSITIYSRSTGILAAAIILPSLSLAFLLRVPKKHVKASASSTQTQSLPLLPKKPFITAYRGGMLIITALAIIAVDFNIFPRRFAKVETWGTSLMDLGVGSFVFSMGIVTARGIITSKDSNYIKKLWKSLSRTPISLALGFSRLLLVKNLDYQEHVSEYGVHWNFFITLVLVGPLTILIEPLFNIIPRFASSLLISFTYEWFITKKEGFLHYLLLAQRTDLISSNREGIFSLIGYLAIFIAGQSTGIYILPSKPTKNNLFKLSTDTSKLTRFDRLTTVTPITGLIFWFFTYGSLFYVVLTHHDYAVSRRFANLPYVLWVCTYNTGSLVLFAITEKLFSSDDTYENRISVSLDSINSNGMLLFLLANVSTGLINLTFNTLDASYSTSLTILIGYSLLIATVGAILYKSKIFIKL